MCVLTRSKREAMGIHVVATLQLQCFCFWMLDNPEVPMLCRYGFRQKGQRHILTRGISVVVIVLSGTGVIVVVAVCRHCRRWT